MQTPNAHAFSQQPEPTATTEWAAGQALVEQLEGRLVQAQRTADVAELDALIADDLLFADLQGRLVTKAEDLAAHGLGRLRLARVQPLQQAVRVLGETTAVASVLAELAGTFDGQAFEGQFRYLRVWAARGGRWQVVAGHVTAVAEPA